MKAVLFRILSLSLVLAAIVLIPHKALAEDRDWQKFNTLGYAEEPHEEERDKEWNEHVVHAIEEEQLQKTLATESIVNNPPVVAPPPAQTPDVAPIDVISIK